MTEPRSVTVFFKENYAKQPKRKDATNKTFDHQNDDAWNLGSLIISDYVREVIRGCRIMLVVIDKFSKFGWTARLKKRNAQIITKSFKNIFLGLKKTEFT